MARQLTVSSEAWPLARPFAISRGTKTEAQVVVVEITDGTAAGRAECVPYPHYGESVESVAEQVRSVADAIAAGAGRTDLGGMLNAGAARNAVDCALWDLEAKQAGKRAWELAGIETPQPAVTAETIGLASVSEMAAAAQRLKSSPLIKIKLDGEAVIERMAAVHENAPGARLIIDPNEGWNLKLLADVAEKLERMGVEMIEQPLPAGADDGLAEFTSPVPLCADESCHTADDLERLRGKYDMVNIKLDKSGGLTEGLALARAATDAGFAVMVGCMVGTSLAMAPATLLAPFASIVDLDGPLLLKQDREPGLDFSGGLIHPPEPGIWG